MVEQWEFDMVKEDVKRLEETVEKLINELNATSQNVSMVATILTKLTDKVIGHV